MGQNRFHIQSTYFQPRYRSNSAEEAWPSVRSTGRSRYMCRKKQDSAILVHSRKRKTVELEEENTGEVLRFWSGQDFYIKLWLQLKNHVCSTLPSAGCIVSAKILDFCVTWWICPAWDWLGSQPQSNNKIVFFFSFANVHLPKFKEKVRLSQHGTDVSPGLRPQHCLFEVRLWFGHMLCSWVFLWLLERKDSVSPPAEDPLLRKKQEQAWLFPELKICLCAGLGWRADGNVSCTHIKFWVLDTRGGWYTSHVFHYRLHLWDLLSDN